MKVISFSQEKNLDISCRMFNLHFKAMSDSEPILVVNALKFNYFWLWFSHLKLKWSKILYSNTFKARKQSYPPNYWGPNSSIFVRLCNRNLTNIHGNFIYRRNSIFRGQDLWKYSRRHIYQYNEDDFQFQFGFILSF